MTLREALQYAGNILQKRDCDVAQVEARILLSYLLDLTSSQIYGQLDSDLNGETFQRYVDLINRRLLGEPVAYITGHREFYGLDFYVDPRVLIPRPETELLVEKAIEHINIHFRQDEQQSLHIADIGTGSGAIAISLATHVLQSNIYATDISDDALEVARMNSRLHGVEDRICFLRGNLLDPLPSTINIILANLPYISTAEINHLSDDIACFEPIAALHGGYNGLYYIENLLNQIATLTKTFYCIFLEIGYGQFAAVKSLILNTIPESTIELFTDLGSIERCVKIGFPSS